MAAGFHDVVRSLKLDRPCIAGVSMGGTGALQYALDHPDDISIKNRCLGINRRN